MDQRSNQDDDDSDDDNPHLSEHAQSMRKAARYCCRRLSTWKNNSSKCRSSWVVEPTLSLEERQTNRQRAYQDFWNESISTGIRIPSRSYSEISSISEFRKQFHDLNLPCIITFPSTYYDSDSKHCFRILHQEWRRGTQNKDDIDWDWFRTKLGADAIVPVRFQPVIHANDGMLDDEGRARECETKEYTLQEWFELLLRYRTLPTQQQQQQQQDESGYDQEQCPFYLKDWHLQLILQRGEQRRRNIHGSLAINPPLYTCPPIFEHDLLNAFLTRFTKGDYRFCYWGPQGSFTSRHSDVLHSFSWSYNVCGTKQWTFYCGEKKPGEDNEQKFTVIQKAGQAIFVPSLWQHQVVNLEETISVNHNWVTCANLDLCWQCLKIELKAIEKELAEWGIGPDNLEARESMLRGCVGLDVSAFFLMTLYRTCELVCSWADTNLVLPLDVQSELSCLVGVLSILRDKNTIQLESRLTSVLDSSSYAKTLMIWVDELLETVL